MYNLTRNNVFYPKTETPLSDDEMLSLRNRYDRFNAGVELVKICKLVFGKEPEHYHKIVAWGLDHILYDVYLGGKRVVVRINQTTVEDDYFEVEEYIYKKLIDFKIQNCSVYHVEKRGKNFPYDFIVLDKLMIGDFEKLLQEGEYKSDQEVDLVKKSGQFLKRIHSIKTSKYGFFDRSKLPDGLVGTKNTWAEYYLTAFETNLNTLVDLGYINYEKSELIKSVVKQNDGLLVCDNPVLLHGDYCDHNIISDMSGITGAIDWTDAISGDPLHDIAFWSSFYPKERLDIFLEGYYGSENKPTSFWNTLNLYLLRINVSKAVLRHKYGIPERVPLAINKIEESLSYFNKIDKLT